MIKNPFLTSQANNLLYLAFGEIIVRLCGPEYIAQWATFGPWALDCPPPLQLYKISGRKRSHVEFHDTKLRREAVKIKWNGLNGR